MSAERQLDIRPEMSVPDIITPRVDGIETNNSDYMALPEALDNLEQVQRKLESLAMIVESGESLALHTGYRMDMQNEKNPEELAKMEMAPMEREQYEAWAGGAQVPGFDFEKNKRDVPSGHGSEKRYRDRAAAMKIVWKVDDRVKVTGENASWLTTNMSEALPLVIAVCKVEAYKMRELSPLEMAEAQIAHKIVATAMKSMNNVFRRYRMITCSIDHSKSIIQAREHAIKRKMSNYRKRQDPINKERAFVNKPEVGNITTHPCISKEEKIENVNEANDNINGQSEEE